MLRINERKGQRRKSGKMFRTSKSNDRHSLSPQVITNKLSYQFFPKPVKPANAQDQTNVKFMNLPKNANLCERSPKENLCRKNRKNCAYSNSQKYSSKNSKKANDQWKKKVIPPKSSPSLKKIHRSGMFSQKCIRLKSRSQRCASHKKCENVINSLKAKAEDYRIKYEQSIETVLKMKEALKREAKEHEIAEHTYQEKIRILRSQLLLKSQKRYSNKIGHLFTYDTFDQNIVVPDSMILENSDENFPSKVLKPRNEISKCGPSELMENSSEVSSLSVNSK